jgi:hypothetical protein
VRTESIMTLPNVLAIHLGRSRVRQIPDGEAGKRPFRHNGELLPQLGTFRPTDKSAHSGFSFDHGHFEARIPKAQHWFRISDRHISELDRGPSDNADSQTTILICFDPNIKRPNKSQCFEEVALHLLFRGEFGDLRRDTVAQ